MNEAQKLIDKEGFSMREEHVIELVKHWDERLGRPLTGDEFDAILDLEKDISVKQTLKELFFDGFVRVVRINGELVFQAREGKMS